jgi:hypothetical protein
LALATFAVALIHADSRTFQWAMLKRITLSAGLFLAIVVGLFVVIQLIPIGLLRTNPPVVAEPPWDSPATRALAKRACFDCHSNETVWPWYSRVAPVSWLVVLDTVRGRRALNFSEWGTGRREHEIDEVGRVVSRGEMPPSTYLFTHPDAKLTPDERRQLADGLLQSLR